MSSHHPSSGAAVHALIPCAGSGSRAGEGSPKQYRRIGGRMLVEHAIAALRGVARIDTLLVVVAPGDDTLRGVPRITVADCGGATRADTVRAGLAQLLARGAQPSDWVLVHDAARCLLTPELAHRLIEACETDAVGGLLALPLADTLKQADADGRVEGTLPREALWVAQTPQMFRIGTLADALEQAGSMVTDEASAIERLGHRPLLVRGSPRNFKVTWPEDFTLAEALL